MLYARKVFTPLRCKAVRDKRYNATAINNATADTLNSSLPVGNEFSSHRILSADKASDQASRYWRKNSNHAKRPMSASKINAPTATKIPLIAISCESGRSTKPCAIGEQATILSNTTIRMKSFFIVNLRSYAHNNTEVAHYWVLPKRV